MNNKTKIGLFFASALVTFALYNSLFQYSLNAPGVASWWLKDVFVKKEQISKETKSPRLVILSGSNGLFGFDGELLNKETGIPVVNLAMHASLDLKFYEWIVERNVRKGDIVIIPVEFNYYTLDNQYNSWFIDNIMAWGGDYLEWLNHLEYVKFMSHVELRKVSSGALSNWFINNGSSYKSKLHDPKEIASYKYDGSFHEYDFRSVDDHGDILAPNENKRDALPLINDPDKNRAGLYYMKNAEVTSYGVSSVSSLVNKVESVGAKAVVTWPSTMRTKYFSNDDNQSVQWVNKIKTSMSDVGVEIKCTPWSVNIEQRYFYDTAYHLNREGAVIRTRSVLDCLYTSGILKPSR
ncbi:hypothetical protein SMZ39_001963 [Cronobacter turicensis]|nr:hypothetical protein [Cronobacter turicensis]ELY4383698.1 hypothetical protein [Cronobacter turicensis]